MTTEIPSKPFSEMVAAIQAFHDKHSFKGTRNEDLRYRMALHLEELGELSAAVTKGLGPEKLTEELADNLILILGTAVSAAVPLEAAFWAKTEKIMRRPATQVGDTVRVTETGNQTPPGLSYAGDLRHLLELERKKLQEAHQSNVRIFQLVEKLRAAYAGVVRLAEVHTLDGLAETAVSLLCTPGGIDCAGAAVYLLEDGGPVRVASKPLQPSGPVPTEEWQRLETATHSIKPGKLQVYPLMGKERRPLGFLEVELFEDDIRSWQRDLLSPFAAYLGLMVEHLARDDQDELRQLQDRLKSMAPDSTPQEEAIKQEVEARIVILRKRLGESP